MKKMRVIIFSGKCVEGNAKFNKAVVRNHKSAGSRISMAFLLFSVFIFFLFSFHLSAQDRDIKKLTPEKKHKVAHNMMEKGSFYNAVDHLRELAEAHPENKKYMHKLADACFFSRDYKNAELWYQKYLSVEKKEISLINFRYAESLKYNGKYEEAKAAFSAFAESKFKDKKGERYKMYAKNEVLSCEYAINNFGHELPVEIFHLGDHVNSAYSEFAPCLWNDSVLVFASLQADSVLTVDPDEAHFFHVKLMTSKWQAGEWGEAIELPAVNSLFDGNANGTFSPDGSKFYFARCTPDNRHDKMICKIFVSEVKDGVFQKPVKLSAPVNIKGSTSTQPHIAEISSGKSVSQVLYFVSDRKGSKGGMDIWYSIMDKEGNFTQVNNMGAEINTIRDEISPFYDKKNGTFYFSSNFHFGFGGYDVFRTKKDKNRWDKPENIGRPVNSRVDDTYYTVNNRREGFFVSNRPEGYHLTSETCCDDIYSYRLRNPFVLKVKARSAADNSMEGIKITVQGKNASGDFYSRLKSPVASISSEEIEKLITKPETEDTLALPIDMVSFLSGYMSALNDSLARANDNLVMDFIVSGFSRSDVINNTHAFDPEVIPQLEDENNIYYLDRDKEYVVYAISEKDTVVYTFITGKTKHDVSNQYIFQGDSVVSELMVTADIDLLKVEIVLPEPIIPDTVLVKEEIREDEQVYTVTKLIGDLRDQKKDLKIILNYDFDDTKFIEKHSGSLDSLVMLLKEFPEMKIEISAHTDNMGTEEYNNKLSKRRAKSIEDYLSSHGISRKRMTSKGYGESMPLVPNSNPDGSDNPENRYLNRRAEIRIIDNG